MKEGIDNKKSAPYRRHTAGYWPSINGRYTADDGVTFRWILHRFLYGHSTHTGWRFYAWSANELIGRVCYWMHEIGFTELDRHRKWQGDPLAWARDMFPLAEAAFRRRGRREFR